jgi:hypothetical protein
MQAIQCAKNNINAINLSISYIDCHISDTSSKYSSNYLNILPNFNNLTNLTTLINLKNFNILNILFKFDKTGSLSSEPVNI